MTNTLEDTNPETSATGAVSTGPAGHDWRAAGEAWGHAALEWSSLFEHYAVDVVAAISERTAIGQGDRVLDVACGSGWTMRFLRGLGAAVAGIDAADRLLDIARDRNPGSEVVHGSMFELPWEDHTFDVVTSINGIWGGCDDALLEARRVLRPGGSIGLSFWATGEPLDLRPFLFAIAGHLDHDHVAGLVSVNNIGAPGVAEEMLAAAGFEAIERGHRVSTLEWPDEDTAWRALRSIGPIVPALRHSDPAAVRRDAMAAIEHCRSERGGYRFQNVHDYVVARTPVTAKEAPPSTRTTPR